MVRRGQARLGQVLVWYGYFSHTYNCFAAWLGSVGSGRVWWGQVRYGYFSHTLIQLWRGCGKVRLGQAR